MKSSEIENVANETLIKAGKTSPKIMAANIAEFIYGLEFEWRNLNQCSEGKVLAAISIKNKIIYLNESFKTELKNCPGRMNFTIAHQIFEEKQGLMWFIQQD